MSDINRVIGHVDASTWNHIKCGACKGWFAIEGQLAKSYFFCPHCGKQNLLSLDFDHEPARFLRYQAT